MRHLTFWSSLLYTYRPVTQIELTGPANSFWRSLSNSYRPMMTQKKFLRKVEDFQCGNCGAVVTGNGYTNHCPSCLYSKHVDNNPGDRKNECHGLMEAIRLDGIKKKRPVILHQCLRCGVEKRNMSSPDDDLLPLYLKR